MTNSPPTPQTWLRLNRLELPVFLGLSQEERLQKQLVWVDIILVSPTPSPACTSDQLQDTCCYAKLIEAISQGISTKKFHLVERLGQEIYLIVKSTLKQTPSHHCQVKVEITKHPDIANLKNGVCFHYGDGHRDNDGDYCQGSGKQ